jgi:hypothetical protein
MRAMVKVAVKMLLLLLLLGMLNHKQPAIG